MLFSRVSSDGGLVVDILVPSLAVGFGFSLMWIPMTIAAVSGVPDHQNGVAFKAALPVSWTSRPTYSA